MEMIPNSSRELPRLGRHEDWHLPPDLRRREAQAKAPRRISRAADQRLLQLRIAPSISTSFCPERVFSDVDDVRIYRRALFSDQVGETEASE
jgi:hypothetical protein